jgi:WD40 repeat protein
VRISSLCLLCLLVAPPLFAQDVIRADLEVAAQRELAATSTGSGTLLLWNTNPWSLQKRIDLGQQRLFGFDFSADGRRLSLGTQDGRLLVIDIESGDTVFSVKDRDGSVSSTRFGPANTLFAAGQGSVLSSYDLQSGALLASYDLGADTEVEDFEVIAERGWLLIARFDQQARLMDIESGKLLHTWQNDRRARDGQRNVKGVEVAPDGNTGYFAGVGGSIIEIDLVSGKRLRSLQTHPDFVSDIEQSHDGRYLVAADLDGTATLVDIESFTVVRRFKQQASFGSGRLLFAVAFLQDGKRLVTGGIRLPLIVWDQQTGARLQTISELPSLAGSDH